MADNTDTQAQTQGGSRAPHSNATKRTSTQGSATRNFSTQDASEGTSAKNTAAKSTSTQGGTTQGTSTTLFLVTMYIAAFVAAFNENIINVALTDIMSTFSVSATTAQWLVSGYMIVTSIFTAIMAFLSGRFSTRALLFTASGCLVVGEALCLVAPSFGMLLPSRILQAAGSGILFPLMMNCVLACAPREKMGFYLSLGGACITLGPAFGPVISGHLS